jgi:hypothetical protein
MLSSNQACGCLDQNRLFDVQYFDVQKNNIELNDIGIVTVPPFLLLMEKSIFYNRVGLISFIVKFTTFNFFFSTNELELKEVPVIVNNCE